MKLIHIQKSFGKTLVLKDISLKLVPGKCIVLYGHNGCGKSTLLNIMAGFLHFDGGELQREDSVLQYIPDHFFTTGMNARDFLMHMGAVQGMDHDVVQAVIREYFHKFFMEDMLKTPMKYLSKGSLQKVAVIQALLQTPAILLMDEPLNGQDIASQRVFAELIEKLKQKGVCIVMAVHEQQLIQQLADIIYEIRKGMLYPITAAPALKQIYLRFSKEEKQEIRICADEESDACVQQYLQQGWHLEEARYESSL